MHDTGVTMSRFSLSVPTALASCFAALLGCGEPDETPRAFQLRFVATSGGQSVGCVDRLTDLGPSGDYSGGVGDLRFYVSNLRLYDAAGAEVEVTLDESEFQLSGAAGQVSMIDLTGSAEGTCAGSAIAFAEGTARTNDAISGTTVVDRVARVTFDVGVPQALMKDMIATTTAEAAPSPLNEMYWSWATGYRHFVFNLAVETAGGEAGGGYLHIGSRDCGAEGELALESRDACSFVNTPSVALDGFDLEAGVVAVDLDAILAGLDFVSPIYDPMTFEVIGEGPGVECHSSPMQGDCARLFTSFGLDIATGKADPAANVVFKAM
jgi:uncharacterized repeat protein (TIGR04052 family)